MIDLPPIWLLGAIVATWWIATLQPDALTLRGAAFQWFGGALVVAGLLLIILAIVEMRRHRTTVIPHMEASQLVSRGVFAFSRNPIYLGDTLILIGLVVRWGAPIALLLVPVFVIVITRRFIQPEETGLSRKFPGEFAFYSQKTRRWL